MAMVIGLNLKASVKGAKKLKNNYWKWAQFEEEVTTAMNSVANVCFIVDMWLTTHRSWIEMLAHLLDEKSIARKSVALYCKRIS